MASLRIINIYRGDIQTIWSATEIGRFSLPSKNVQNSRLKKRSGLFAPGAKLVVREGNKTYTERVSSLLQETQKHRNTDTLWYNTLQGRMVFSWYKLESHCWETGKPIKNNKGREATVLFSMVSQTQTLSDWWPGSAVVRFPNPLALPRASE